MRRLSDMRAEFGEVRENKQEGCRSGCRNGCGKGDIQSFDRWCCAGSRAHASGKALNRGCRGIQHPAHNTVASLMLGVTSKMGVVNKWQNGNQDRVPLWNVARFSLRSKNSYQFSEIGRLCSDVKLHQHQSGVTPHSQARASPPPNQSSGLCRLAPSIAVCE